MSREIYVGGGLSAIDQKGRVAIPNQLRGIILENSGGVPEIQLTSSTTAPCLAGFDKPYTKLVSGTIERDLIEGASTPQPRHVLQRQAFSVVETMPFDASGRFIISPLMRKLGGLDDLAYFFGCGDYLEVWNPTTALNSDLVPRETKIALEFYLDARSGK
jgi:MraZ protein